MSTNQFHGPSRSEAEEEPTDKPLVNRERTRRVKLGAKSGAIATAVMTTFRMPISHSPPPTANVWATYVTGKEPEDHLVVGLLLHVLYGIFGGIAFSVLSPVEQSGPAVEDELRGVLAGLGFGMFLSVLGERVLLNKVLGENLDRDEQFIFHLSHVIYGLTLGAWYGSAVDGNETRQNPYEA